MIVPAKCGQPPIVRGVSFVPAPELRCHFPNIPSEYPSPAFAANASGSVNSEACNCGLVASVSCAPIPVRKGCRPVSIEARDGEHVGCARALVKSTPLFFSAAILGIGGKLAPAPAVSGKLSAPRSSAMMKSTLFAPRAVVKKSSVSANVVKRVSEFMERKPPLYEASVWRIPKNC